MKNLFLKNEKNSFYFLLFLLGIMLIAGIDRSLSVTDFQDFYIAAGNFHEKKDLYHLKEAESALKGLDFLDMLKNESQDRLKQVNGRLGDYIYPPTFAFLIQPLGMLGYETASLLFFLLNFSAFVGIIYFLKARFGNATSWFALLVVIGANILYIENHLNNNQIGFFLLFLVLAALQLTPVISGLVLSLAIVIKLTPLVFLFYFLVFKKYREMIYTLLFLGIWIALPFLAGYDYNIMILENWYDLVLDKFVRNPVFRAWKSNQSLVALIAKYFFPVADPLNQMKYNLPFVSLDLEELKMVKTVATAMILAPFLYRTYKGFSEKQLIAVLFILSILLSGISWVHSFVYLVFPVFYLYEIINKLSKWDKYFFYFLAVSPVVFNAIEPDAYKMFCGLFYTGLGYYYLVLKYDEKTV